MEQALFKLRAVDVRGAIRSCAAGEGGATAFAYAELGQMRSVECDLVHVLDDGDMAIYLRSESLKAAVTLVGRKVNFGTRYFFKCPRSGSIANQLFIVGSQIGTAESLGLRSASDATRTATLKHERFRLVHEIEGAQGEGRTKLEQQLWKVERKLGLPRTEFQVRKAPRPMSRDYPSRDTTKHRTLQALSRSYNSHEPGKLTPWLEDVARHLPHYLSQGPTKVEAMPEPTHPRAIEDAFPFDIRALAGEGWFELDLFGTDLGFQPSWATEGEHHIGFIVDNRVPDDPWLVFAFQDYVELRVQVVQIAAVKGLRGGRRWYLVCANTGERRDCIYYAGGQFMSPKLAKLEYASRLGKR